MTRFIKFACGMMVSLALRSCRPMVVISLGFWFDFREEDIPCDIVSDWQSIQIWIIITIIIDDISIFLTFQQWWLFPWSARSSWRARGWDSTFPLLSDQRSPPSNFHRQDSFIIYQLSIINTSVFTFSLSATSKLKFSSTQGSSGRYLVAYPSNLISPMLQGYVYQVTSDYRMLK